MRTFLQDRNRLAWLLLMLALVLHVIDEAATGFLPFYNELVISLREKFGFFPMPTFEYSDWLGGLIAGLTVGLLLTALIPRAGQVPRILIGIFSGLMIGNALLHLYGSVLISRFLPGFWSSVVLLPAAAYMLWRVLRGTWPSGTVREASERA